MPLFTSYPYAIWLKLRSIQEQSQKKLVEAQLQLLIERRLCTVNSTIIVPIRLIIDHIGSVGPT